MGLVRHSLQRLPMGRRSTAVLATVAIAILATGFRPTPPSPSRLVVEAQTPVPEANPSMNRRVAPQPADPGAPRAGLFNWLRPGNGENRDTSEPAANRRAPADRTGSTRDTKAQALLKAYPGAFRIENNTVIFPTGERITWNDGRTKTPAELLTQPDVEDMFHYAYPAGRPADPPGRHQDPGRIRNDAFFKALYGQNAGAVRANLRAVPWVPRLGGGTLLVTTRFGVDRKLEAVSRDLERLPARLHRYLVPSAGTFNWRVIAGTSRQSVHSFGAAIDINTKFTDYWRWNGQQAGGTIPYRNKIPVEIVNVFEKHCFIWGGRWYHYDTMHFEYRPEFFRNCP